MATGEISPPLDKLGFSPAREDNLRCDGSATRYQAQYELFDEITRTKALRWPPRTMPLPWMASRWATPP